MRFIYALASLASVAIATKDVAPLKQAPAPIKLEDFKCPTEMAYCPWAMSCSCQPGLVYDMTKSACAGTPITGAWPLSLIDDKITLGLETANLVPYCAASPTKIVEYDALHPWCQADLQNIVFLAPAHLAVDLKILGVSINLEIDLVKAKSLPDLLHVCAGLQGLYLERVTDAVLLFNTDKYGLSATHVDINIGLTINTLICLLDLGACHFDCVSYCRPGCANYIDVKLDVNVDPTLDLTKTVGGAINGLVGCVILPDTVRIIDHLGSIVNITVEHLLCIVGKILTQVLAIFNCGCK
ncbi:hypothetical protein PT974_09033 [Cladobotryum mycophilum]|uniref:Secreted protein n=1 Tax=Cladobotryum mycophilum TaxID=491253 RepID=A0ABR0SF21_9HYPO